MSTKMTETDWAVALEVFSASLPRRGAKGRNDLLFLEALHYFSVHNITWRALPERFGKWNSVWKRFDRLSKAGVFETFDASMAAIYAARTGLGEADVMAMLDGPNRASDGTYMTAAEAVEKGFADAIFDGAAPASAQAAVPSEVLARRRMEAALARQGVGRRERADMINALVGQRDATRPAARDAGDLVAGLSRLVSAIRS